jgi:hypothetical protein
MQKNVPSRWRSPGERGFPPDPARFACRGLIWWHGEWEAENAPEANEAGLVNDPLLTGLRVRYANQLSDYVLKPWWNSMAALSQNPDKVDEAYCRALDLVVVQLPAEGRNPPDLEAHIQYWKQWAEHEKKLKGDELKKQQDFAAPISVWRVIRHAQMDVVNQMQSRGERAVPNATLWAPPSGAKADVGRSLVEALRRGSN